MRKWLLLTIWAAAFAVFEYVNVNLTGFAFTDLQVGLPLSITLAIAFVAIDFAGVGRAFSGPTIDNWSFEDYALFGAWGLAAVMNAMLWGWAFWAGVSLFWAVVLAIVTFAIRLFIIAPGFAGGVKVVLEQDK